MTPPSPRSHRHAAPAVLAVLAALLLAGCVQIGRERPELAVYAPRVAISVDPDWPRLALTLAIAEPQSSTALDSPRIAVRPQPGRLQVYAGAAWSDRAPALVQAALVDAFDQSGRFAAVTRPTGELGTDLRLDLDLRQFEAVYAEGADAPTATLELQATLVDVRQGRVLATRLLRIEEPAERSRLTAVIPRFEAALSAAGQALVPWVLEKAAAEPGGT